MVLVKKRLSIILLLSILLLCISGCVNITSLYGNKVPYRQPGTRWVSADPDIYFEVAGDRSCKGEIKVDKRLISIIIHFGYGKDIHFFEWDSIYDVEDDCILIGICKFSSKKLVVTIDEDYIGTIFDKSVKEITFIRENP